jgi:hypothetical protein
MYDIHTPLVSHPQCDTDRRSFLRMTHKRGAPKSQDSRQIQNGYSTSTRDHGHESLHIVAHQVERERRIDIHHGTRQQRSRLGLCIAELDKSMKREKLLTGRRQQSLLARLVVLIEKLRIVSHGQAIVVHTFDIESGSDMRPYFSAHVPQYHQQINPRYIGWEVFGNQIVLKLRATIHRLSRLAK